MPIIENTAYGQHELLYNQFMEPALRSAIQALALPPGSHGLDAGCGPGGVLRLLDVATGGVGPITGIDLSPALLELAQEQVDQYGLAERIRLACVDMSQTLPFPDNYFDWVWSADVLCSDGGERGFADPAAVIQEMARVVKPGGQVAIFLGNRLGAMFIPGYGHIENCLATATALNYRKHEDFRPSFQNDNVLTWLREAGLTQLRVSAHITEYQAPLHMDVAHYIQTYVFEREYAPSPELKQYAHGVGLTEAEWETWLNICNPRSPNYVLRREDYYCVRFGTLATGRVVE